MPNKLRSLVLADFTLSIFRTFDSLSYRFGLLKSSTDTTIAVGQNIAPNAKVQVRLSNQDTFKEFYGSVKTNCANSVSNKANIRSGIVSPADAQLLAGGANLNVSTANTTGTTPSLEQVLNPFDIPVSSENITDEQIAEEIDRIKNPNDEIETPCGTIKIDDTSCDPLEVQIAPGTKTFSPAAGKYMYINGYEILITAPNEGLLYLPLVKSRVPVGWQGLSIKESLDGTYGCVESGQVQMQGSQSGAIAADLHRQVMALLTQGPGSFSGKFGEAVALVSQQGDSLQNGQTISWATAKGALDASKKGFETWQTKTQDYFTQDGGTVPPEVQIILDEMQDLQNELARLSTCVVQNIPTSGGGDAAPLRLKTAFFACTLTDADKALMAGLTANVERITSFFLTSNIEQVRNVFYDDRNVSFTCQSATGILDQKLKLDGNTFTYNSEVIGCEDNMNSKFTFHKDDITINGTAIEIKSQENSSVKLTYSFPSVSTSEMLTIENWFRGTAKFPITGAQLKLIFPGTSQARCDEVAELINKYSDKFEINTKLRMAHFLGQIGWETGGLKTLKEIPCYKENSIKANFGTHYCDLYVGFNCINLNACATKTDKVKCTEGVPTGKEAIKDKYICTPDLFDYVYSCSARLKDGKYDLGNGAPTSKDGSTFLGRGFIQLTGKYNYRALSNKWNADPENSGNEKYFHKQTADGGHIDELENNLDVALKASMYYWELKKCNIPATNDDTAGVTLKVKGSKDDTEVTNRGKIKDKALTILE